MKKRICKPCTKRRHRCLECGNNQAQGSYCISCCATELVTIGPGIPAAGTPVQSMGDKFLSLGELDRHGRLRVAMPGTPDIFYCAVDDWVVS